MKEKEIEEIIKKGEARNLEFKESLSVKDEIGESISAFSNSCDGKILVGVSDLGEVKGLEIGKKTIEHLANFIKQNTDAHVYPDIKVEKINNKNIIVIEVKGADEKPVFFKGKAYTRIGKSTHKLSASEIRKLAKESTKSYWDEQICKEAKLEDIDEDKVKWFLRKAKAERNFDVDPETPLKEALEKLKLIKDEKLTNAAVLLFGKNPQVLLLQVEVRCAKFKGNKPAKPFLDMKVLNGSVYEQIDNSEKFVLSNIKKEAWTEAGKVERQEKWEYPPDAVREAVTNALCHRDYETSSNVHISIFDDRIEIWNPGKLPEPLTPEDLKKVHKSIPVNPLIASKLFLIRYIEKWGSGTNDIVKYCLEEGLPEPEFREETGGFSVVFRKDLWSEEYLEKLGLNERQIKAVMYTKEKNKITNIDYQRICNVSERTASRELSVLVRKAIFKRLGITGKGTRYVLKDAIKTP